MDKNKKAIIIIIVVLISILVGAFVSSVCLKNLYDSRMAEMENAKKENVISMLRLYGEDVESLGICIRQDGKDFYGVYQYENVPNEGYKVEEETALTETLSVLKDEYLLDADDLAKAQIYYDNLSMYREIHDWEIDATSHNFISIVLKNGWEIWIFVDSGTIDFYAGNVDFISEFEMDISEDTLNKWYTEFVPYLFEKYDIN